MIPASTEKLQAAADICEGRPTCMAWCALQMAGVQVHIGPEWRLMDQRYGYKWEKQIGDQAALWFRAALFRDGPQLMAAQTETTHATT